MALCIKNVDTYIYNLFTPIKATTVAQLLLISICVKHATCVHAQVKVQLVDSLVIHI